MLSALAVLLFAPTTVSLVPSDDVWVYENASDPAKDAYLRIWGSGGHAVAEDPGDAGQFSYGLLRWDLGKIPAGVKITAAKLVVKQVANPGWTVAEAKAGPLEARAISGDFSEKDWSYDKSAQVGPIKGNDALFGSGFPAELFKDEKPITITIDLLVGKSQFASAVQSALGGSKSIALALTSTIDPAVGGRSAVYKVCSKDAEKEDNRPSLVLTYEQG